MEHIIAIDVASEVSSVVVMTEGGKVVMDTRISTSEANLRYLVKSVKGQKRVVFEECGQAAWLYSFLEPLCSDVFVCNPKKNKDLSGHAKTDDNDAFNLADRLRLGALYRVWHGGKSLQELRELLRDYQSLTKDSTSLKNQIKAIFRNRGISIGTLAYKPETRSDAIKKLPLVVLRSRVERLGEILDKVTEQRNLSKLELVTTAKKQPIFKSLVSIPNIGDVFASSIIAEIGTPLRFRTRQQFWSYCGFAIKTYESSQYYQDPRGVIQKKVRKAKTRGLVTEYNTTLKCVFKQVALDMCNNQCKDRFKQLQHSGVSAENARLTIARKVAAITLHLMKTGEIYDQKIVFANNK